MSVFSATLAATLLLAQAAAVPSASAFSSFADTTPSPHATATAARASAAPSPQAHPVVTPRPQGSMSSGDIVGRYDERVAAYHMPPIVTFNYTVEQAGNRGISQQHRIYRSGMLERDETIEVQGNRVKPRIRIYRNRSDAYALAVLAPRQSAYTFTAAGMEHEGGRINYIYHTTPLLRTPGYMVTSVTIDGQTFLPVALDFTSSGAAAEGHGHLHFGQVERAWVVLEAEATAGTARHALRERILFSEYHFPRSLPAATFGSLEP